MTSDPFFNVCINTARNKGKETAFLVNLVQEHKKFKITVSSCQHTRTGSWQ